MSNKRNFKPTTSVFLTAIASFIVSAGAVASEVYYVDLVSGDDSAPGSESQPWRSLQHARGSAKSGATVVVGGKAEVAFVETVPPNGLTDFVTFVSSTDAPPTITSFSLQYASRQPAHLRFSGFRFKRRGAGNVVVIENASRVHIVDSDISAEWPAYDTSGVDGVVVRNSSDIEVRRNRIHTVFRGIQVGGSSNILVLGNYITPVTGTAVQWIGGNTGGLIEGNHIHGQTLSGYPGGAGAVPNPHASMISIRSDNLVIRGNLMHDMGNSSGMMFYQPDVAGGLDAYSNITIENNLIYGVRNAYGIRMNNLGTNVVVRNNLVFSRFRTGDCSDGLGPDARYRYQNAFQVHSLGSGFDGSGLSVHNNIFIGIVAIPETASEGSNVAWSWQGGPSGWREQSPSGTSLIFASSYKGCNNHPRVFEDRSFFAGAFGPSAPLSFSTFFLSPNSEGRHLGDSRHQSSRTLALLRANGFLMDESTLRSEIWKEIGPLDNRNEDLSPPQPPQLTIE